MTPAAPWRVLGLALLLVAVGPALAHGPAGPEAPDLGVDERALWDARVQGSTFAADACAVQEGLVEPGPRRLLRFSFTTFNQGTADLVLGNPADRPALYTWSDCDGHGHYHFDGFAAYRLWTPEGYGQWMAARSLDPTASAGDVLEDNPGLGDHLVTGHKQGFCIRDDRPLVPVVAGSAQYGCHHQGLSVGWGDTYGWHLDGQWVDVTGVEDGYYVLEAEVNPDRSLGETSYQNNVAATDVYVPPDLDGQETE